MLTTALIATGIVGGGFDHPLLGEFRLRYPAFNAVSDQIIVYWMNDADRLGIGTWDDLDQSPARMLYAAHNIVVSGALGASSGDAIPAGVTRFKSGNMDVAISEQAANASFNGGYGSTSYGQQLQVLIRRNTGGPRLMGYVEPEYPCW